MNNRVSHFEIPCDHPERVVSFFQEAFGWTFQPFGPDYWLATTGDESSPGINGGIMRKLDPQQPVVNTISVENLDQSINNVVRAGGKIVVPRMAVPSVGWLAYFKDPDGNIHGMWELDNNAA